jgi:hypothetical protein
MSNGPLYINEEKVVSVLRTAEPFPLTRSECPHFALYTAMSMFRKQVHFLSN